MTRIIKLQDKGDRLLRATHGLWQKGGGVRWAQLSVGLDASPTGLRSLAFGRDPTARLGIPRERPVSALAHGSLSLEESRGQQKSDWVLRTRTSVPLI